jgi:excisionase family DNA binding protein
MTSREVLAPKEIAERTGFSYHAILRAIRRGDLTAYEPIPGQYRIELADYDRWLRKPVRPPEPPEPRQQQDTLRKARKATSSEPGSVARLRAIEGA